MASKRRRRRPPTGKGAQPRSTSGARSAARAPSRAERLAAFIEEMRAKGVNLDVSPHNPSTPVTAQSRRPILADFVDQQFLPAPERYFKREQRTVRDGAPPELPPLRPQVTEAFIASSADHDYIYTRLLRSQAVPEVLNRGLWSDLDPDHGGDYPGHSDGDVRAYLAYVGITREEWEALEHERRVALRDDLRDLLVLDRAVSAVFDTVDPDLVRRALEFIHYLAGKVRQNRRSPRGFQVAVDQRNRWAHPRALYLLIVYLFDLVKRHFRPALREEGGLAAEQLARQVNYLLKARYGEVAAKCTRMQIEALASQSSGDVALDLLVEIDPKIDLGAVVRARPRHRRARRPVVQ